jgi:ribosome maturation factor RimP
MSVIDAVTDIVTPVAESLGLVVYDIEMSGSVLRISLDNPDGVDLDRLTEANRSIGRELDAVDPIPGRYTLEVSSPGLERKLRTAAHWRSAVGERVKVKLRHETEGRRRIEGTVVSNSDDDVQIQPTDDENALSIRFDDISSARTDFKWGPAPKPGAPERKGGKAPASAGSDKPSGKSEAS